jgi:hypothetical protein
VIFCFCGHFKYVFEVIIRLFLISFVSRGSNSREVDIVATEQGEAADFGALREPLVLGAKIHMNRKLE